MNTLPPLPEPLKEKFGIRVFCVDDMKEYATLAVERALAQQAERHAEELLAYEVAVKNLREQGKPVAWLYDWDGDDGPIEDWLTSNYDEAHSPTMGCHNIRPLFTAPPAPQHTEEQVTLILDAFDNIELRKPLANEVRRILGVPAPEDK